MNTTKRIININHFLYINIEQNSMTSLTKLIYGGAPIFAMQNKNHHKHITELTLIIPPQRNNLRLFNFSYIKFAKQNKPEEQNP